MQAVIVYESMFGNTHTVAERIAEGLATHYNVSLVPVGQATAALVGGADLLVVGGPTHVHTLSRGRTRKAAWESASQPDAVVSLDPDAEGPGLRKWFDGLADGQGRPAVAFDTRIDASALLTGRASKGIARRLARHGFSVIADPESFLVDKHNRLLEGEAERAAGWAAMFTPATTL